MRERPPRHRRRVGDRARNRDRPRAGRRQGDACDIEEAALATAVEGLKHANADVDGVVADVSIKAELQTAAEATIARFGKVHVLVNNAGVGGGGPYGAWTDAAWDWTIGVNLMSVIWGIEIFGPLLERHGEGGHIVSTASVAGLVSSSSMPYNVSKYGVVALSEGLRLDLAPRGDRRLGAVSRLHPHPHRGLAPKPAVRFAPAIDGALPSARFLERIQTINARIAHGIDPGYVGELVREGVEKNWP